MTYEDNGDKPGRDLRDEDLAGDPAEEDGPPGEGAESDIRRKPREDEKMWDGPLQTAYAAIGPHQSFLNANWQTRNQERRASTPADRDPRRGTADPASSHLRTSIDRDGSKPAPFVIPDRENEEDEGATDVTKARRW